MTEKDLPWMKFHGDQFFQSERVLRLRPEHQMLYLRLLWMHHKEGSIPNDTRVLARMCHLTHRAFLRGWEGGIGDAFKPAEDAPGRLVNGKLQRVSGVKPQPGPKDDGAKLSPSEKASHAARIRWERARQGAKHDAQACFEHMPEHMLEHAPGDAQAMLQAMPSESDSESEYSHHSERSVPPKHAAEHDSEDDQAVPGSLNGAAVARLAVLQQAGFANQAERLKVATTFTEITPEALTAAWHAAKGKRKPEAWFAKIILKGPGEVLNAAKHSGHRPKAVAAPVALPPVQDDSELYQAIEATGATVSPQQSAQMAGEARRAGVNPKQVRECWEAAEKRPSDGRAAWWRAEMRALARRQKEQLEMVGGEARAAC